MRKENRLTSYEIAGAVALPTGRGRLPRMHITRKRVVLSVATFAATILAVFVLALYVPAVRYWFG